MTLQSYADRLLLLGGDGRHPAGAVVGVRTADGCLVTAAGWAALPADGRPGVPMTPGLLLDVASVTKIAATTPLVMRLVADGKLGLDDLVRRHLPGFAGGGKDEVTVEQLLTHTGGLQPWWPLYAEETDRQTALLVAQRLPLAASPGSVWRYSDLGMILLGHIVERVSTLDLAEAHRRVVAEPLGLSARYGPVPPDDAATSADSDAYEHAMLAGGRPYPVGIGPERFDGWRDRPIRGEASDGNAAHALGGVAGHAGLFATVDDLLVLGAALRHGSFVPAKVLARFATPSPLHEEQALGFRRRQVPYAGGVLTLLHHPGFTGTWLAFALEEELVVAGGATRLHGTTGPLPLGDATPRLPDVVQGPDIQDVLLEAGLERFHGSEER
ncbi:serine hydrolase domain-containing protein [Nocardioides sp. KR10-350]|uniref:serine hydrolase domain-containing protein n=1 Tax=Nocardioides cheoyonin TaxID=3156615 RepID=UPI0032B31D08